MRRCLLEFGCNRYKIVITMDEASNQRKFQVYPKIRNGLRRILKIVFVSLGANMKFRFMKTKNGSANLDRSRRSVNTVTWASGSRLRLIMKNRLDSGSSDCR